MKNYFRIDFLRFAFLLLPSALRKPLIKAFINAFCEPVILMYQLFADRREANIYRLNITPQVCFLEKALNDRFDPSWRDIHITDGQYMRQLYIYRTDENFPFYAYHRNSERPKYIYLRDEVQQSNGDFIVYVPSRVQFDIYEMRALLDLYKLATKTYTIYLT